jgi:hypothetical protein
VFCFVGIFAQESDIEIVQDHRLDSLILAQGNAQKYNCIELIPGYRIQVDYSLKKDEIDVLRKRILDTFPEMATYIIYSSPYFKLKIGNFQSKEEVELFIRKNLHNYPSSFAIREMVFPFESN